ncbi:unnamed protein product [Calypogeia fissa]
MTVVMCANAAAMPARAPHLNNTIESFRKLKSAFANPLFPHSRSTQQKSLFSRNGVPPTTTTTTTTTTRISASASRFRYNDGREEEEKVRPRLHPLSPFGREGFKEGEERAGNGSRRYDSNFPHRELKSSRTRPPVRPPKPRIDSPRHEKWNPSQRHNRQNFSSSSKGAYLPIEDINIGKGGGEGEFGNEGSSRSRGNLGFQGDAESDLVIEQRRAAFEDWAREKLREDGTSALPAIEEMRQTFGLGSPSLIPNFVSSSIQPERDVAVERTTNYPQTMGRSGFNGSPYADVRKSGMTSGANGGYGSSSMDRQGSSSASPTSRYGAGRSEQQLVSRSSPRPESSPRSSGSIQGSRFASNVASGTGVQFPSEDSPKISRVASTSAGKSDEQSTPKPFLVKRKTKFPLNIYGRAGTVILVDKPQGWTSFAVCAKLRYLLKIQKVGHAGTLDPMATGLLIVCLGKATKLADSYQAMTKVYSGIFRLGELTASLDADTEVSDVLPWEHITDDQLEQAKKDFVGDIFQTPPMYSAIKVGGERLYVKARKGEQIEVPPRLVTVNDFQLERSSENRQDIHFKVTCSKGTYIRSLCADLARAVGSYAHLTVLRREKIGLYSVKDAWPILEFVEQYSHAKDTVATPVES